MNKYQRDPVIERNKFEATSHEKKESDSIKKEADLNNEWHGDYHVEQDDETEDILMEREP